MIILNTGKNGEILSALKSYEELSEADLNDLKLAYGDSKEDYINYSIQYRKDGSAVHVKPYAFSEKKHAELDAQDGKPDVLDAANVMFGNRKQAGKSIKKYGKYAPKASEVRRAMRQIEDFN